MNRITRTLLALPLVGVMAACASATDGTSTSPEPMGLESMAPMASAPTASEVPMASASAVASMASHDMGGMAGEGGAAAVSMENFVFVEDRIEVAIGTTVTWTNADATRHTVTSGADDTADGSFDSDDIEAGESFRFTFAEAGEFPYFCDIHPTMTGVVVVTP